MCAWSAVIDVSDDMEGVDGETLDEVAHRNDEIVGTFRRDDGADDDVDVCLLVGVYA